LDVAGNLGNREPFRLLADPAIGKRARDSENVAEHSEGGFRQRIEEHGKGLFGGPRRVHTAVALDEIAATVLAAIPLPIPN